MSDQERATRLLNFRESASAGRWISRGIKIRLIVMAVAITAVLWGTYQEPDSWTIGAAGFFSGIVFTYCRMVLAHRRALRDAWPFTEMVTDWNKVSELAGVNPAGQISGAPSEFN